MAGRRCRGLLEEEEEADQAEQVGQDHEVPCPPARVQWVKHVAPGDAQRVSHSASAVETDIHPCPLTPSLEPLTCSSELVDLHIRPDVKVDVAEQEIQCWPHHDTQEPTHSMQPPALSPRSYAALSFCPSHTH